MEEWSPTTTSNGQSSTASIPCSNHYYQKITPDELCNPDSNPQNLALNHYNVKFADNDQVLPLNQLIYKDTCLFFVYGMLEA